MHSFLLQQHPICIDYSHKECVSNQTAPVINRGDSQIRTRDVHVICWKRIFRVDKARKIRNRHESCGKDDPIKNYYRNSLLLALYYTFERVVKFTLEEIDGLKIQQI